LAEVLDLAKGKQLEEVTRAKNQDLVAQLLVALRGGQMPLQQRVPKFGFSSRVNNNLKQLNL